VGTIPGAPFGVGRVGVYMSENTCSYVCMLSQAGKGCCTRLLVRQYQFSQGALAIVGLYKKQDSSHRVIMAEMSQVGTLADRGGSRPACQD
jgi:hypothetical protein